MQDQRKTGTSEVEAEPDTAEKAGHDAPSPGEAPKRSEVEARPEPVTPEDKTDLTW